MLSYNPSLHLDSLNKTQRMNILCPGRKGKGVPKFGAISPLAAAKRYQTINKNF
jgi:hypothetical protein